MRIRLDKIASSTRNVGLFRDVTLGSQIPAEAGTLPLLVINLVLQTPLLFVAICA